MKVIEKKRLSRSHKTMIILGSVLIGLILSCIAAVWVPTLLTKDDGGDTLPTIREDLGEALYLNSPIAYPRLESGEITSILVSNKNGTFDLTRYPDNDGSFWFGYTDGDGVEQMTQYIPPIMDSESGYDYEDFYATEKNDGYGLTRVLYLCTAVGTTYFKERIDLPEGTDEASVAKRNEVLARYGFTSENEERVSLSYAKKDITTGKPTGETGIHHVVIGGKPLSGTGYYFRVDGRNCIYYTNNSYFDYALMGFHSFVNGMLVSKGLASDSAYGQMLVADFKQWVNTEIESGEVVAGANVIAKGDITTPIRESSTYTPEKYPNGYDTEVGSELTFDLSTLTGTYNYDRINSILLGKQIGEYENGDILFTFINEGYQSDNTQIDYTNSAKEVYKYNITEILSFTTPQPGGGSVESNDPLASIGSNATVKVRYIYTKLIEGEGDAEVWSAPSPEYTASIPLGATWVPTAVRSAFTSSKVGVLSSAIELRVTYPHVKYTYEVTAIEAVITDGVDITTAGASVGGAKYIRVTYNYKIGGVSKNAIPVHAVIDISQDGGIPAAVREALSAASVGTLPSPVVFDIDYTNSTCPLANEYTKSSFVTDKLVLGSIVRIYDRGGVKQSKVTADSYVEIRYFRNFNGKDGEILSIIVDMRTVKENELLAPMYDVLLGRGVSTAINVPVYTAERHHESLREFKIYNITKIELAVTKELIVSFKFANFSERDPYYGESIYTNTTTNKEKLYGLNSNVCDSVIKMLGGIATESTIPSGYGGETVAVGLTHEVMKKYNLYDYTIYLELPRGVKDSGKYEDKIDYIWDSTTAFTLYISREDPVTGKRYVGSSMYDLVAEVDADDFEFLEYDYVEFWARKQLFMLDIGNIGMLDEADGSGSDAGWADDFTVEFFMSDVYGKYTFDLDWVEEVYAYFDNNGKLVESRTPVYLRRDANGKITEVLYEKTDGVTAVTPQEKLYAYVKQDAGAMNTKLSEMLADYGTDRISLAALYGNELLNNYSAETLGAANLVKNLEVLQNIRYTGILTEEEKAAAEATNKLMSIKFKVQGENASPYYYVYEFYRATDRKVMVKLYQVSDGGVPVGAAVSDFYIDTTAFKRIVSGYVTLFNVGDIGNEVTPYPDDKYTK